MAQTYAAKKRSYQVLAHALAEEKRLGLLSDEEFDKRHEELMRQIFGACRNGG